jgi:uncharacterized membrane protein HdeD (DUF308 family)
MTKMATPKPEGRPVVDRQDSPMRSLSTGMSPLADHWVLLLTLGVVTVGLGIVLSIWPGPTLRLLAVLVSLQLLVTGLVSIVGAVASQTADRGARTITGIAGIVGVLVGLVLLRAPQQTVVVVGLLVGLWWVFKGLVDVVRALSPGGAVAVRPRGWAVAIGLFTAAAGTFVVLNPEVSFTLLLVVVQVWLFGYGFLTILAAVTLRAAEPRADTAR